MDNSSLIECKSLKNKTKKLNALAYTIRAIDIIYCHRHGLPRFVKRPV